MQKNADLEIKEEFIGDALRQHMVKTLAQVASSISGKFEDEICVGTHSKPVGLIIYEFPCIFTAKTVTKKRLLIFHKKSIEKKMILEVIADGNEIDLFVFDERVVEAAKEAFEKLKSSKEEFRSYEILIKKDFMTDS